MSQPQGDLADKWGPVDAALKRLQQPKKSPLESISFVHEFDSAKNRLQRVEESRNTCLSTVRIDIRQPTYLRTTTVHTYVASKSRLEFRFVFPKSVSKGIEIFSCSAEDKSLVAKAESKLSQKKLCKLGVERSARFGDLSNFYSFTN